MLTAMRSCRLIFAVLLLALPMGTQPMPQPQSTEALRVAAEVIAAYEAKQWARVAQLTHPQALAEFQSEHLTRARQWQSFPVAMEVPDSIMPPEVAKYFDDMRTRVLSEHGNPGLFGFAGVDSIADLERMSPEELLVSYLEGHDPKPEQYDGGEVPSSRRTILGSVSEGDSATHVLYRVRTTVEGFSGTERVLVLTLRRSNGIWRILLNDDIGDAGSIQAFTLPPEDR